MNIQHTCPECNKPLQNPKAHYCPHCRADLQPFLELPPTEEIPVATGFFSKIYNRISGLFDGETPPPQQRPPASRAVPPPQQAVPPASAPQPRRVAHLPTRKLSSLDKASQPLGSAPPPKPQGQLLLNTYQIAKPLPLTTCNYYQVTASGQNPALIREADPQHWHSDFQTLQQYATLEKANVVPNVVTMRDVTLWNNHVYTVMEAPRSSWQPLSSLQQPVDLTTAMGWTLQIGHALKRLQPAFGRMPHGVTGRDAIIIVDNNAKLADLTVLQPTLKQPATKEDVLFLGELLFYLLTTDHLDRKNIAMAHEQVRGVLRKAQTHGYSSIQDFLKELQHSATIPVYERELRQNAGSATHMGRQRDHNEDFAAHFQLGLDQGAAKPVGLYIVADGMGGHEAGERASSSSAKQAFLHYLEQQIIPDIKGQTRRLHEANSQGALKRSMGHLIAEANNIIYTQNQRTGSDRGSTITAALVIGNKAVVGNVGDSRTYRWRRGEPLEQLSEDHSLVWSLYKAGEITHDEIYSHEQKNQIYRSLGDKAQVQADIKPEQGGAYELERGDWLLLCSDGLWEMVYDDDMVQLLEASSSPQQACDRLLREANVRGGEDNISVIIVALE